MPTINCIDCKKEVEVTEKEKHWKKQCKKCFAIMKQKEGKSESEGKPEPSEIKPALDSDFDRIRRTVDDVGLVMVACRDKAEVIFGNNLKPEHTPCINTMCIETFKRLRNEKT